MARRCRRCKGEESIDKPLFGCVRCRRYYHSACHRPHPSAPATNWVCKRCLADQGLGKRRYYHDISFLPSRAASPSSAAASLSSRDRSRGTSMATSSATDTATSFSSSFASQQKDSAAPVINCPVPGCPAKIDAKRQVICEAHLRSISTADLSRDAPQEVGSRPAGPRGTSSLARQPMPSSSPNPRKLLQETEKDRPMILRRKTAGNLPQFIPQQPIPGLPSRSDPTLLPPSVQLQFLAPPPTVQSPPASPAQSRDSEPAWKRQRLSPSPGHSPKGRVNGISSTPSSAESGQGGKPVDSGSPRLGRRPSNGSPQRVKDGKTSSKPNTKHPVRRMPLQLSNLRFIDSVEESTAGVLSEQSRSGLNGWPRNVPQWTDGESVFALRKGLTGSWTENMGIPTPPVAQVDTTDTPREAQRTSNLPNGYRHKAPPPMETPNGRTSTPGLLLAKGCVVSKQPELFPQTEQTSPVLPAPIAKPKRPVMPNQKEIDTAHFDALVYSQPGASTPPPGVELATIEPAEPLEPPISRDVKKGSIEDEPLYLDIDPRIHWPQPHSAAWHAAKQREIRARGKKKANFGRAAESLRRQRQEMEKQGVTFEDTLPEKILENPAWVRALRKLNGLPPAPEEEDSINGGTGNTDNNGVEAHGQEQGQEQGQQKKGRKPGRITGKKVGPGRVVVTGLDGVELKKRLGDGLALKKRIGGRSNQ